MSTAAQSTQASLQDFTTAKTVNRKLEQLSEPYTDAQVLRYLYWDCAMSLEQIGDMFGVSGEGTIWRWMRRHDIERRDRIEAAEMRKLRDGPFSRQSDNTIDDTDNSTESKWSFQD